MYSANIECVEQMFLLKIIMYCFQESINLEIMESIIILCNTYT